MSGAQSGTIPAQVGRYEVKSRIAMGGMGEVYLARAAGASGLQKQVVIKRILPHLAKDPAFVARFLDEARLMIGLSHSNIVQVFDVEQNPEEYFLVMEYVEGCDLRELLRRQRNTGNPFPLGSALLIAHDICEGLGYVHSRKDAQGRNFGIVHRDVSPSNVLISRAGEVKLTDFGVALARQKSSQSVAGTVHGKFQYMSPEQATGAPLDARSDIFAVGTVLYEMLSGVRPFDARSDLATLDLVKRGQPRPLKEIVPSLPPEVGEVVAWCHQHSPLERPQSAYDLAAKLQQLMATYAAFGGRRELASLAEQLLERASPPKLSLDDALALQLSPDGMEAQRTATAGVDEAASVQPRLGGETQPVRGWQHDYANADALGPRAQGDLTPGHPFLPHTIQGGEQTSGPASSRHLSAPNPVITSSQLITGNRLATGSQVVVTSPRSYKVLQWMVGLLTLAVLVLMAVNWQMFRRTSELRGATGSGVEGPALRGLGGAISELSSTAGRAEVAVAGDVEATPIAPLSLRRAHFSEPTRAGRGDIDSSPLPESVVAPELHSPPPSSAESRPAAARAFTISARPPSASISIDNDTPVTGPRRVTLEPGSRATAVASLPGHRSASATVRYDGPRTVQLTLEAESTGEVAFRYFPANATVWINGRALKNRGSNLIIESLPAGQHELRIGSNASDSAFVRTFAVQQGQRTQLGTLRAD